MPVVAALYEFVVKGRKRLGYRVQMDTTATNVVETDDPGVFDQLREPLVDPTLVLLRIENNGQTHIDEDDYAVLHEKKAGVTITFPDRKVVGMVVTELSDDGMRSAFEDGGGLAVQKNRILLPKVPMNRGAHYKVLAALDTDDGKRDFYAPPKVACTIKGGVTGGKIQETRSRMGTPKRVIALIGFLVAIVIAQLVVFTQSNNGAPLDCASGHVNVTGSTAFAPIVQEAAKSYQDLCPGATFAFDMRGSGEGLQFLDQAGRDGKADGQLTFSDGEKPSGMPALLPRPIAFVLFTLVVNGDTGVSDLTIDQIKQIYQGKISNWQEIGGKNLPIRLISRNPGSGTRNAFQRRILGGIREPGTNSDDCHNRDPGSPLGVVRCARDSTDAVLRTVADVPGAMGYSELGAATDRKGLTAIHIDGHPATVVEADHGTYPFWETEFGYTVGEPRANSLAASFLRYLTNQVGADIIRSHGDRPCAELANPQLCRPT
ncbi:PstS family phosphate ABC transporter substrate-binding protein [Paractinoplanes globisporus]|uniref:PstS family phosphate ABC transporter substrate-binding protein n=1 Tax=Paractinoplanes globisporus TaxID=113565 RepID=A0ABW6WDL9_9ACTN|nr:substrate-binding domain-containing protein [Actinoplanes globisporus]